MSRYVMRKASTFIVNIYDDLSGYWLISGWMTIKSGSTSLSMKDLTIWGKLFIFCNLKEELQSGQPSWYLEEDNQL